MRPEFQWKNKVDKALFRGANTGENLDSDGNPRSRLKLMKLSIGNENYLDVYFSMIQHQVDIAKKMIPKEYHHRFSSYRELCEDLHYKYLIAIDGWASGWLRAPLILKSNSVPIIVET